MAPTPGSGNLSAVLQSQGNLVLEDTPTPQPQENEVQLQMAAVGICGSDVHYWTNGRIGDFIVKAPMILGHEASGVVSAVGSKVTSLKVGDRVAVEPGVPCRMCEFCKGGRYNLCPEMSFCATPPVDGSLRRYYCHAADFCYKLPEHVSLEEGALLEPLSVGVHACKRAGVTAGSRVLICGAGPIGLVNLLTAKAMGAASVAITDLEQNRLDVATKLGADHAIRVDTRDIHEMVKRIHAALGEEPSITIECTGAPPAVQTGIHATKPGGVLVLVGMGPAELTLPIITAAVKEVDIRGIFRYVNCYPTALDMVATGKVNVKPLITHHFKLTETLKAFETAKTGEGGAIKVMIHCDQ
ncbi:sorbitol dehydrogenase-like [Diadema setosum]|uniref:sorbitol dehydrogenase-like n=1 Tax=Diadema setosum TaxID=31175 RepID=UPI003B3A5C20